MAKIHLLSTDLRNKIAAGEVVERPASVVKELVENSLDANATEITIVIEKGGHQLIQVSDNGGGISPDDMNLAVERYTTNKIETIDDLFNINSLGFRGEALPSIAAVSRFELITTARGESVGTRVTLEGPLSTKVEPAAGPQGTRIDVRDLFWNTPAHTVLTVL